MNLMKVDLDTFSKIYAGETVQIEATLISSNLVKEDEANQEKSNIISTTDVQSDITKIM